MNGSRIFNVINRTINLKENDKLYIKYLKENYCLDDVKKNINNEEEKLEDITNCFDSFILSRSKIHYSEEGIMNSKYKIDGKKNNKYFDITPRRYIFESIEMKVEELPTSEITSRKLFYINIKKNKYFDIVDSGWPEYIGEETKDIEILKRIVDRLLLIDIERINYQDNYRMRKISFINLMGTLPEVCEDLTNKELIYLIKIITLLENKYKWGGGSVASVIWLYRMYKSREGIDESESLTNWILNHTSNSWVPFGNTNFGARSVEEYRLRSFVDSRKVKENIEVREKLAEIRKLRGKIIKEKHMLRIAMQKILNEERKIIIKMLETLPYNDCIRYISEDYKHHVFFYPFRLINLDDSKMQYIDRWNIVSLARRIRHINKKEYKKLYVRLEGRISKYK